MMFIVVFVVIALISKVYGEYNPSSYLCSMCINTVEYALTSKNDIATSNQLNLLDGCRLRFPNEYCEMFFSDKDYIVTDYHTKTPRKSCAGINLCPSEVSWSSPVSSSDNQEFFDIRVSKAMGSRGYDKIRLSVISNQTISSNLFDYNSQFKYKWTNMYLNTGIVTVKPGTTTTLTIAPGKTVDITIPSQGAGVRGLIMADPCFQSDWVQCLYQDKFQMFSRFTTLLNTIFKHDDISYWQILGDNFYDQTGDATSTWFNALTDQVKSHVFHTVPGNHDIWVHGSPKLYVSNDQLGNGFMQFYGQDVIASTETKTHLPYDFTHNPDLSSHFKQILPSSNNFFFYNQVGNVGFIGYSGAYTYEDQTKYFNEACTWAASVDVDVLLVLGHWNSGGDGGETDATVPAVYSELLANPSCQSVASKLKYFMGHKHCNWVTSSDTGFMVGALGMHDKDCTGEWGIPVVDTLDGAMKVYYFPIQQLNGFDNYSDILSCIDQNGISGCYHLATLWSSTPLTK